MTSLVVLGLALGLDSFRAALVLGALPLTTARRVLIALAFGVCDGLAPLVGLAVGTAAIGLVGPWVAWVGPFVLAGYGVYVIVVSRTASPEGRKPDSRWILFGLPLSLSLDNLVAGVGLGALGFPVALSAVVLGVMSALMAVAGMFLAVVARRVLDRRADLAAGIALVALALWLAVDRLGELM